MIINLVDRNIAKVLLLFSTSPGSRYYRNEIKEKTEMNNVPLDNSLNELLTLDIIKLDGRLYSLNYENGFANEIVGGAKEKFGGLPLKVQFEIIDLISEILKLGRIRKIILFGSYSKLIYSEKSDIDIAVVLNKGNKIEKKIELFAEKISKKYKKEIQAHFFSEGDLKHKEDPLIRDILKNGRVLIGEEGY